MPQRASLARSVSTSNSPFRAQRLVSLGWRELSGGPGAPCHDPLQRLAAKGEEQDGGEKRVEECGADQAAEDRHGDRMQDLAPRLVGPEQKWDQGKASRECGHQHRGEALPAAPDHEVAAEALA